MKCPKHPTVEMTALFTSWVCDICDPPKKPPGRITEPMNTPVILFDLGDIDFADDDFAWQPMFNDLADDIDDLFDDAFTD